jgi:threonine aldolase
MLNFRNDYSYGAHPKVLEALAGLNETPFIGYGDDDCCAAAADRIRALCACPQAAVHFISGGTQANLTAICAFLRPWESVLSPATGHIHGHEAGSIEATGHKIIAIPVGGDGKLTPDLLAPAVAEGAQSHCTVPRLVYLSNATEVGTCYTLAELTALSDFCRANDLLLFLDGARLGAALAAPGNDLGWADLGRLVDAFYIGGTKNGALFGEALVVVNETLQPYFFRVMKQRGAVLAKGWLMGAQFDALLKDGLYLDIAAHADAMAARLQDGVEALGYRLMVRSQTNQIFLSLPRPVADALSKDCTFEVWGPDGEDSVFVRFVTCFATTEQDVDGLLALLKGLR